MSYAYVEENDPVETGDFKEVILHAVQVLLDSTHRLEDYFEIIPLPRELVFVLILWVFFTVLQIMYRIADLCWNGKKREMFVPLTQKWTVQNT